MEKEIVDELLEKTRDMTGDEADSIIVNLIDCCDDKRAAEEFGVTEEQWHRLVDVLESTFRWKIRNIR